NRRNRSRLRGTARTAVPAGRRRSLPHPLAVVDTECEQAAAFAWIKLVRTIVAAGLPRHFEANVGKRDVHIPAVRGRAPFDSADSAAFADASLPQRLSFLIRI